MDHEVGDEVAIISTEVEGLEMDAPAYRVIRTSSWIAQGVKVENITLRRETVLGDD